MTVKELKQAISNLPDDMEVYIPTTTTVDYDFGRVFSVRTQELCDEESGLIEACIIDEK